jgi:hypothetical protein
MIRSTVRKTLAGGAVALLLGGLSPAASARDVRGTADHIMSLSYRDFATYPHGAPYDWTTDGCTAPPPITTLFTAACVQHDFGYANYGAEPGGLQLAPTRATKDWIDARFLQEMERICADEHDGQAWCTVTARVAFEAVSRFGDPYFWG